MNVVANLNITLNENLLQKTEDIGYPIEYIVIKYKTPLSINTIVEKMKKERHFLHLAKQPVITSRDSTSLNSKNVSQDTDVPAPIVKVRIAL